MSKPTIHRVLLADDHLQIREGVRAMLSLHPDFTVIGETGDGAGLMNLLAAGPPPDVVILDVSVARLGGLDAIREIMRTKPDVKVLVLTMYKDEDLLCQAFLDGADGYLLKDDWARDLLPALDAILNGRAYVSPTLEEEVENTWLKVFIARKASPAFETLSSQEVEILKLLAHGESNEGIARSLGIPAPAVLDHRSSIIRKLNL